MKTQIIPAATPKEVAAAVSVAVEHLRAGEAIALPTETVYGLAADALNADACLKIFEAKERPRFDPLIVHLPGMEWLDRLTSISSRDEVLVRALVEEFWPGPLTIVLPRRAIVPDVVTAGLETVAVRISAHPVFAQIIEAFDGPLAAPSANRFGRISPTTAAHVAAELDGKIPLIVDGGSSSHGLESTIVAVREGAMEILRHGPISAERLAAFGELRAARSKQTPEAPGQLPSHYAPRTPLRLTSDVERIESAERRMGALIFEARDLPGNFCATRVLSLSGDVREAAANLFRYLRELDEANLDLIVAEEIPETGLGRAIMDRLRRAAAR